MCFLTCVFQVCAQRRVLLDIQLKTLYNSRKKTPSFKGSLPGLASAHPAATATQGAGLLGERRTVALRELREKQELTEQRRR